MSRGTIVTTLLVGCLLAGLAVYGLAQGGETSLPLYRVPAVITPNWAGPKEVTVNGRIYGDAWHLWCSEATFRLDGAWDRLEMRLWLNPEEDCGSRPERLLFFIGGKLVHEVGLSPGQKPLLLSIPVTGQSAIQIRTAADSGRGIGAYLIGPRVVRGGTPGSVLRDIFAGDGEIVHIATPGDYRIRYRR